MSFSIPGIARKAILAYSSENTSSRDGKLTSNTWTSMKRMSLCAGNLLMKRK
jgi:hypothetical protein